MRPKESSCSPKAFLMYVIKEPRLNESREILSKAKQGGFFPYLLSPSLKLPLLGTTEVVLIFLLSPEQY